MENLEEMDRFLNTYNVLKVNHEDIKAKQINNQDGN